MTDLAVIIVNWNTRELLRTCLSSLYQYTTGISYEIVVVDNGSADGSSDMVKKHFPDVRLMRNQENLGYSQANNQALRRASSRYMLLLNSDTALKDNALQGMVFFMDTHPSVGIAGTKLLNPDGSRQYSCDLFPRTALAMLRDKILDTFFSTKRITWPERMTEWDFNGNFAVDYVIGAVLLIRRETLEQIGLLDEQFFMYAEDIDWCYRAALAGWKTYYLGAMSIYHCNRGSSETSQALSFKLQQLRGKSLQQFYRKHYGLFSSWLIMLIDRLKRLQKRDIN